MTIFTALHGTASRPPALPAALPGSAAPAPRPERQRDRIFDLSGNLHCSLVGTCLTTGDLRQLFARLGDTDARTATSHAIHHRAVQAAGRSELAGKLLNKLLDKKHAGFIRRFARAKTRDELAGLWREALESGDIPGAYWAVMSHPLADDVLVREAFGEVHMLSHLVGTSNRLDIARLSRLETEVAERDETIARQEARIHRMVLEQADRARRIDALEAELAAAARPAPLAPAATDRPALELRLQRAEEREARLAALVETERQACRAAEARCAELAAREALLAAELDALQAAMAETSRPEAEAAPDLSGRKLLYVGGRPGQVDQARALTRRWGGTLLSHDGGIEENPALLPGLVSQADAAFFPVDCISHNAMGQIKKLCGDAGKPFLPLRSASLASYASALRTLPALVEGERTAS